MQEEKTIFTATPKRAYALDALRGFAVLSMILSGTIAYRILPAWMYHAQEPPPNHTYNPNLPGLTWVDLVFPIFLFSMGAAIPLALSSRLAKGNSIPEIIVYIFKRGFLLAAFAIVLQHFRPTVISSEPNVQKWWLALWGFLILFLMFVRLPNAWQRWQRLTITTVAWVSAIALLSQLRYPDGSGFSLYRSDIILIVLANTAVFGSLIWLFTKSNLWLRVGFLGLLFAFRLSATVPKTWIEQLWSASSLFGSFKFDWLFQFPYLSYLFVVIPGTIAGDLILGWLKSPAIPEIDSLEADTFDQQTPQFITSRNHWPTNRFISIFILIFANCLLLLLGLQTRLVWQTTLVSALFCCSAWLFFAKPNNDTEYLLANLYRWGVYWLIFGLLFEPFQGGIKKDPATFSYYFVTTGISIFILILLLISIDVFGGRKWFKLLIDNGQNPMIAYVGFANLVWPILVLTGIDSWFIQNTKTQAFGFFKGVIYTLLVACIVSLFTRLKLFWRS